LKEQIEKVHGISNSPFVLGSVTRTIIAWGGLGSNGKRLEISQDSDSFQLACIYKRREWMLEDEAINSNFLVSERCAVDEAAYQGYKEQNNFQIPSKYYYSVAVEEAKWEATNYWDRIYYIPVDDRGVEDDGVRPLDKNYQLDIDSEINRVLIRIGKFTIIKEVPLLLEEWPEFFEEEVRKWKK